MKQKLFIITGPTGSGKTDISLRIAQKANNVEIISADSMQIYRGMDIGTAKVSEEVRRLIPHHMIDIVDPWQSYSLGKYIRDARAAVAAIESKDKQALIVGGTGLYIKSLIHGIFSGPEADWRYREELNLIALEKGPDYLHDMLAKVDPVSAARLHKNDHKRVIRALEVYEKTGAAISGLQKQFNEKEPEFEYSIFVINRPKDDLRKRIDDRVENMFKAGLVGEVMELKNNFNGLSKQARQALGYNETLQCLNNEITLDEAKENIKRNTKKFAKRQLTWFKSFDNALWISPGNDQDCEKTGDQILDEINKAGSFAVLNRAGQNPYVN